VDNQITYAYIEHTLGVGKKEEIESFFEKLREKDTSVLEDFENLKKEGKNLRLFFRDVLYYGKDALVADLHAGKPIGESLILLDSLQDALLKSKNSYDEAMIFLLTLLSVLSGKKDTQPEISHGAQKITTPRKEEAPQQAKKEPQKISEQESLSPENVSDIFSLEGADFETDTPENPPKKEENTSSGIDASAFIESVKKE